MNQPTMTTTKAAMLHKLIQRKCGIARIRRKKTVRRERLQSSVSSRRSGWSAPGCTTATAANGWDGGPDGGSGGRSLIRAILTSGRGIAYHTAAADSGREANPKRGPHELRRLSVATRPARQAGPLGRLWIRRALLVRPGVGRYETPARPSAPRVGHLVRPARPRRAGRRRRPRPAVSCG